MFKRKTPRHRGIDWSRLAPDLSAPMHLQALEPRVLLDAAAAGTAAKAVADDSAHGAQAAHEAQASAAELAQAVALANPPASQPPASAPPAAPAAATPVEAHVADPVIATDAHIPVVAAPAATHAPAAIDVYFVERDLPDVAQLVAALPANAEVHYIEPGTDGVKDMAQALAGRTGIGAIHILAHGSAGELDLGTAVLTTASMQGQYHDDLVAIGNALAANGDTLSGAATISAGASGSASLTLAGTQDDINATLATLVYQGNANFNGTDTLTVLSTDSATTPLSDSDTVQITVSRVNDAPVNTLPPSWATSEDTSVPLSGLSVADVDAADGVITVTLSVDTGTITADDGTGVTIARSGTASIVLTGTLTDINAYLASAAAPVYVPVPDANGTATLTMLTNDAGNTGSGGALTDSDTATITIMSVNDAPVNTVPGAQSVNEDTALAFAGATAITVNDVDGNLATTQLTVTSGTLTVTLSGAATLSAGANGSATLTISGTQVDINATLASLTYQGNLDFTGSDTLTVVSADSASTPLSDADTVAITIGAVNDPPVNTLPAAGWSTLEDVPVALTGLSVADADAGAGVISVQLSVGTGTLTATSGAGVTVANSGSGSIVLSGSLADINAYLASASAPMYVPVPDANGDITLTMLTNDAGNTGAGGALTDSDTAVIAVAAINDPPVNTLPAAGWSTDEDVPVPLTGISVADVDAGSGTILVQLDVSAGTLSAATAGNVTVTGSGTGSIVLSGTLADINAYLASAAVPVYTPVLNSTAPETLTMTSNDQGNTGAGAALLDIDISNVAININQVNDPPMNTLPAAGWTTPEDSSLPLSGLSVADTDAGTGTISVQLSVSAGMLTAADGLGVTVANSGTGSIVLSGDVLAVRLYLASALAPVYLPPTDFNGAVTLTMLTNDGGNTGTGGPLTDLDTATITVSPVNDAPIAANDGPFATAANTAVAGNVILGSAGVGADSDVDGDALTVSGFAVDVNGDGTPELFAAGATANLATNAGAPVGTLVINADGSFFFTPAPAYDGPVPHATYTLSDGQASAMATLSFVDVPDAPPNLANDTRITDEDTPLHVTASAGLLANDSDPDGDVLAVTGFTVAGQPGSFAAGQSADIAGVGVLTINVDGSYAFVPAANYHGPVPLATYTASDGSTSRTATLNLSVTSVNDPPVVQDDAASVPSGGTLNSSAQQGLLANDSDADGDTLVVTGYTVQGVPGPVAPGTPVTIDGVGVLTINADGSYSFTAVQGYAGSVPPVSVSVSDGQGGTSQSVLSLTVQAPLTSTTEPVANNFVFVPFPGDGGSATTTLPPPFGASTGAVLTAVESMGNLDAAVDLGTNGIVLSAVNDIASLDGTSLPTGLTSLGMPTGFNAVSHASQDRAFNERLSPSAFDRANADAFNALSTGTSLQLFSAPGRPDVVLQMQSRGQQIWIGVDDATDRNAPIRRVSATLADGRALPAWVRVDPSGLVIVDLPAGTEVLRLRITVERSNGQARVHNVDIDTGAIEMHERRRGEQRADAGAAGAANGPGDFAAQLARASRRPAEIDEQLMAALS